jgi:hypothetical protein
LTGQVLVLEQRYRPRPPPAYRQDTGVVALQSQTWARIDGESYRVVAAHVSIASAS